MDNNQLSLPDIGHQNTILSEHVDPLLEGLLEAHHESRFTWFPSELLPCSERMSPEQIDEADEFKQQCQKIPDYARIALVLNLITEEGLPSYHRLLHEAFGQKSLWRVWSNQWTAEEDRHGNILRDVIRDGRLVDMVAVEKMQFKFIADGWMPEMSADPYGTITYTSFQERATQVSHRNLGNVVRKFTPRLGKIFACIAGDESRHYQFYASLLKKILEVDAKGALESILFTLKAFKMPGHDIPGFSQMSLVEHSVNIFGPKEFSEVIDDVLAFIGLDKLKHLDDHCQNLRQKILEFSPRLQRFHKKLIARVEEKVSKLKFECIYHRQLGNISL